MKEQMQNVFYGVLDYVAYPAAMLLAAPMLMHTLGVDGYGLWSVMAAIVSAASIVASGFGDAAIKQVSRDRVKDPDAVLITVRTLFLISAALAVLLAVPILVASPWIAARVARGDLLLRADCSYSILLVSLLIVQRVIESVFISTQRAYERYGAAVRISIFARIGSLVIGILTAALFPHVWCVLLVTALCNIAATVLQHYRMRQLLHVQHLRPLWNANAMALLFQFGKYSWLLAVSGVVFGQLDRLFLGMWLGAPTIAAYAICAQIAQPIYGVSAAGLHVLFPYLSHRAAAGSSESLTKSLAIATAGNIVFAVIAAFILQAVGLHFLALLGRAGLNSDSQHLLAPLVWSSSLLAISVVPTYALYALDRVHLVALVNVLGAFVCIGCMAILGLHFGAMGIALARLAYGLICILLYLPLWRALKNRASVIHASAVLCEEV
ncbi:lipopolysaccharide biosynthesis protein [Terriglobus roseus]|uniref:Membrane protein involved in the export of O-antigen and teichoic acid n=1 Tax=Terriglobus roseus TaxID=392734 RepID=A0A1G7KK54_9BACT|nr:oligosaccharide flippase family protein [Terriglobus roseus]SDF37516.1 Membrane protein involved in the export of O-antigen and teichoic acid [Terriglobus roseus]